MGRLGGGGADQAPRVPIQAASPGRSAALSTRVVDMFMALTVHLSEPLIIIIFTQVTDDDDMSFILSAVWLACTDMSSQLLTWPAGLG